MLNAEEAHPEVGRMADAIARQVSKRYPHEVATYRELSNSRGVLHPYQRRRLDKFGFFISREIGHAITSRWANVHYVTASIQKSHGLGEDYARACVVNSLSKAAFRIMLSQRKAA